MRMVPADPWPHGKVTYAFPVGATFAGRGGPVVNLRAVDLPCLGEVLGAHFRVPVSPVGEVLSSPQIPVQDN